MRETRRRRTLLRRKDGSSEVIRGHQRPSEAIRGHRLPSEVIRGHEMPSSERWRGPCVRARAAHSRPFR
jgi:hypothetical protein